ncbi:GTP cyclohydrolase II [Rothia sp. AR01]|uniref:GTP cyclohydrolase-2 n=1 Tax=Rothia santali TaxID=2949643 RepID=A0A9X2KHA6_9MICC|nr:GTP cyclohydrolase II [Rothia santali]MCP3425003.1 GTP cyclohydrolase II [Rothia santali]
MPLNADSAHPAADVERVTATVLPTVHGIFDMIGYQNDAGTEHVALVYGDPAAVGGPGPLVRIHSECLTGDAFGSLRCDCGEQLAAALSVISAAGAGVVVYARGHEGRGIGLLNKLRAYELQDGGLDTVDANIHLGLPAEARDYAQSAAILRDLGVSRIRLLSSNPAKQEELTRLGIEVTERVRLPVADRAENARYLDVKRSRMGHDHLPAGDVWSELTSGRVPEAPLTASDRELVDRYGPLVARGSRFAVAQLGQSLDGFIASRTGDAEFVTGEEDRTHLHRLRALVDAVLVGWRTVESDDPQLTVRAVSGQNPTRVILDPGARTPRASGVLTDDSSPTLWLIDAGIPTPEVAPHVTVLPVPGLRDLEPAGLLDLLAERGLGRVLVEGGGRTVSRFVHAGAVDRLYLTTAALLIGDGVPGLRFAGEDVLADARRFPARQFMLGEDVCTVLDLSGA